MKNFRVRNAKQRYGVSDALFKKKAKYLSKREKMLTFIVRFSMLIEKQTGIHLSGTSAVSLRRCCVLVRTVLPSTFEGRWPSRWRGAFAHSVANSGVEYSKEPRSGGGPTRDEDKKEDRRLPEKDIFRVPEEKFSSTTHNQWVHHEPEVKLSEEDLMILNFGDDPEIWVSYHLPIPKCRYEIAFVAENRHITWPGLYTKNMCVLDLPKIVGRGRIPIEFLLLVKQFPPCFTVDLFYQPDFLQYQDSTEKLNRYYLWREGSLPSPRGD